MVVCSWKIGLVASMFVAVGCTHASRATQTEADIKLVAPTHVQLSIVDATYGLGLVDGTQWDGCGKIPPGLVADVARLLATDVPFGPVVDFIAREANHALAPPDPIGWAEIHTTRGQAFGERVALRDGNRAVQDSFTPIWSAMPGWRHVELTDETRVRISLRDEDLVEDDPAGVVEFDQRVLRLRQALESGRYLWRPYQVPEASSVGPQLADRARLAE
jgi:hypothetical protein